MDSKTFMDEVLDSDLCPDRFVDKYQSFLHTQAIVVTTLNEFHRVCANNDVPYQLAYGSLLGAIRDNGQIPWDYDADVFVPYSYKDHLLAALNRDLNDDYYYYCPEIDPKCPISIMRLTPKGYRSNIIHVDIFFLIGTPEDRAERDAFETRIRVLATNRLNKLVRPQDEAVTFKRTVHLYLRKLPLLFFNADNGFDEFKGLCSQYPIKSATYCTTANTYAETEQYRVEDLRDTQLISTSSGDFYIPKHYDALLTREYGDYMSVPPLKERLQELHRYCVEIDKLAKITR